MSDLSHLAPVTDLAAVLRGDATTLGGWIGVDEIQRKMAGSLPDFARDAPRRLLATQPSSPILLYMAWVDVLGGEPPYNAQEIGDCVSHGHGHANDLRQCIEVVLGEPSEYRETDTEFIYAASRETAGILGNMDGSYGCAAADAMMRMGMVSREALGPAGEYSGARARLWGKTGAPATVKEAALGFMLGSVAKISTREAAISCLWNGAPFTICSNRGFTTVRDAHGFCKPSGSWGHCMFVCGWRPPPLEGFLICQSWGPNSPTGPLDLDQPTFSFWCDPTTMVRDILSCGDSWGLFRSPEFVGHESLPSDWSQVA